jgi:hypothetical protein
VEVGNVFGCDQGADLHPMDRKIPFLSFLFVSMFTLVLYYSIALKVPYIGIGIAGFKIVHNIECY